MRKRVIESKRDENLKSTPGLNPAVRDRGQDSTVERLELTGPQGKMLAMQSQRGNQYVLRMMNQGAFPGAKVQREYDSSDEEQGAGSSNSMIGDLLGVKEIPGKVKQVVDKTQQGVNQGLDWV